MISGQRRVEDLRRDLGECEWPQEGLESVPACPVCGSRSRSELFQNLTDRVFFCAPGQWSMFLCRACRSAYLDPRPKPEFIHLAYTRYFTHAESNDNGGDSRHASVRNFRRALGNGYRNWRYGTHMEPSLKLGIPVAYVLSRYRRVIDADMRLIPRAWAGGRLLDVGAGNGDYLLKARSAGWDVVGVEPDAEACAIARSAGLDVHNGGIDSLAVNQHQFDVVTINHVIEHVHDPRALLQQAFALLRPSGVLCIETPNVASRSSMRFGGSWYSLDPPRHLVVFNWDSLKMLIGEVGFECIRSVARNDQYANIVAKSRSILIGEDPEVSHKPLFRDHIEALFLELTLGVAGGSSDFITLVARKS